MAGIGFELKHLSRHQNVEGILRAYGFAAVISSGPWIISIFALLLLTYFLRSILNQGELDLFSASVTHAYAFSLILVGPLQLVLTRHAADRFFTKSWDSIFPACYGALALTALLSAIVGGLFFHFAVPGNLLYQVSATALLVLVSCIFIVSNYLNALQDYQSVVLGFAIGYAAACLLAWAGAQWLGSAAVLPGFVAGHGLLLVWLIACLHREFGRPGPGTHSAWDFLHYFRRFPALALCGFFYSLGIWADKLVFWWFSGSREQIVPGGLLYAAPQYDTAVYLSFLSIVPGMAVFFLKLETDFAGKYSAFFSAIEDRGSLQQIQSAKTAVILTLRAGLAQLFKIQGLVTAFLVVFAHPIATLAGIGSIQTGIFQITLFGAFLLVCFLSLLTILFYFDDQRGVLLASLTFALLNIGLSLPTILMNEAWHGFGFVVAAGLALLIVTHRVNHHVACMDEMVFRA